MESLERKKKRYERELEGTISMSRGRPVFRYMASGLIWGLIMGPMIYFIDYYEEGFTFSWVALLKEMGIFFVGGVFMEIIFVWLFYPYMIRSQKKKLAKVEKELLQKNHQSEARHPEPRS